MRNMHKLRVMVANEPRSYREAIATTFQLLRPDVEVAIAEPEAIDAETARLTPHLAICSRLTASVKTAVLAWIELYPEHESIARICVGGEHSTIVGIELADLLSIVDRAESLAKAS